jgi:hypothetical protein
MEQAKGAALKQAAGSEMMVVFGVAAAPGPQFFVKAATHASFEFQTVPT